VVGYRDYDRDERAIDGPNVSKMGWMLVAKEQLFRALIITPVDITIALW